MIERERKAHLMNDRICQQSAAHRGYDPEFPFSGYRALPSISYRRWHQVLLYCAEAGICPHYDSEGPVRRIQQLLLNLGTANGSVYYDATGRVLEIKCCIFMNVIGFERLYALLNSFPGYGLNYFVSPMNLD
jgi:hypothetical protein